MLCLGDLDGQQLVPAQLLLGRLWISWRHMLRTEPTVATATSIRAARSVIAAVHARDATFATPTISAAAVTSCAAILTCSSAAASPLTNARCTCL